MTKLLLALILAVSVCIVKVEVGNGARIDRLGMVLMLQQETAAELDDDNLFTLASTSPYCARLAHYVAVFGKTNVIAWAKIYGYSEAQIAAAQAHCKL